MSPVARVQNWLDERFGWAELIAPLKHKTVPHHKLSYWYFLGGITLFLFIIQVTTGILLLLYYRPSANEAFESVQYISTQVRFGWLVRSIHSWSVLPGITTVLLGLHLALVQRFGISVPPEVEQHWEIFPQQREEMKFFPNFLLREVMAWYTALAALAVLAALFPWGLGTKADPFAPAPAGIKPEWYFLFAFQTLKLIPAKVLSIDGELLGVLAFGAAGALWLILPFVEPKRRAGGYRAVIAFGIVAVTYIASMTVYGYLAQ
jgi:quinol-cytochrome oxidoreductase complex cytochrome b subunit